MKMGIINLIYKNNGNVEDLKKLEANNLIKC